MKRVPLSKFLSIPKEHREIRLGSGASFTFSHKDLLASNPHAIYTEWPDGVERLIPVEVFDDTDMPWKDEKQEKLAKDRRKRTRVVLTPEQRKRKSDLRRERRAREREKRVCETRSMP